MTRASGFYRRHGKRALDVAVTLALSPLLLPLALLIALVVRIDQGSPVLFRQERIGRSAAPFPLRKFRTMGEQRDAQNRLAPDSDRLSRIGALLRRTSLDEIPEFLNILSGDMSLVGPRPLLPRYLPRYSPEQARRHEVPPGLTGLAQVRGRNALDWDEKLAYDVEYVDRVSLGLDLAVLFQTAWVFLSGHGISAPGHATMPEFRGSPHADRQNEADAHATFEESPPANGE